MNFKCLECGHIFEEGEQATRSEKLGDFYRDIVGCPICGGGYEETTRCKICGAHFLRNELHSGVCDECIDEYRNNFKVCKNISFNYADVDMKINALLYSFFDKADIETILFEHIEKLGIHAYFDEFIDYDIDSFAEKLAEEVI